MQIGTADPESLAENAPQLERLDVEAVTLEGVELFQLLCEIKAEGLLSRLPPALHPTIPGVLTWLGYRFDASPWGPFRLVQTRIECRSGTRPRGLLTAGVIDNEKLISHQLALGEWNRGFEMMEKQEGIKLLLLPNG